MSTSIELKGMTITGKQHKPEFAMLPQSNMADDRNEKYKCFSISTSYESYVT